MVSSKFNSRKHSIMPSIHQHQILFSRTSYKSYAHLTVTCNRLSTPKCSTTAILHSCLDSTDVLCSGCDPVLFCPPHSFIPHREHFQKISFIWSFSLIFVLLSWVSRLQSKMGFLCVCLFSCNILYDRESAQGVLFWKLTGFSMLCLTSCLARSALK